MYPTYSDTSTPYHTCSKICAGTIYYPMLSLKNARWVANSVDPAKTPRSAPLILVVHPVYSGLSVQIHTVNTSYDNSMYFYIRKYMLKHDFFRNKQHIKHTKNITLGFIEYFYDQKCIEQISLRLLALDQSFSFKYIEMNIVIF